MNDTHCDTCTCARHLSPERKEALLESLQKTSWETLNETEKWPKNLSLQFMYMKDASDYLRVADHLQRGEFEYAEKYASELETQARDRISQEVWDYLLLFR